MTPTAHLLLGFLAALCGAGCTAARAARPNGALRAQQVASPTQLAQPTPAVDAVDARGLGKAVADATIPPPPDDVAASVRESWQALFDGDPGRAKELVEACEPAQRGSSGALTVLGFLAGADGDFGVAQQRFEQALSRAPDFAPALYGLGAVAEARGDHEEAIGWFQRATDADPEMTDAMVALHIAQLQRARELLRRIDRQDDGGSGPATVDVYRRVIEIAPQLLGPYLELAAAHGARGDDAAALAVLEQAHQRVGDAPEVLEALAAAYEKSGESGRALELLEKLAELEPGDEAVESKLSAVRSAYEISSLPEWFGDVAQARVLYRDQLAALLVVRLPELADLPRVESGIIITDVDNGWAEPHVRRIAELGLMEVFPNHTFVPSLPVTRAMLADTSYRLLRLIDRDGVERTGIRVSDVPPEHLAYRAIFAAVASGVMDVDRSGRFSPQRKVTGPEAVRAVGRLRQLVREALGRPE